MLDAALGRRTAAVIAGLLAFAGSAAAQGPAKQVAPAKVQPVQGALRAAVLPPQLAPAPPAGFARDVALVGVTPELLDDGQRLVVHLSYVGDLPSLPLRVSVVIRDPQLEQHASLRLPASPQPGVAVLQDVPLLFTPRLPPGTYAFTASVVYDGRDANPDNDHHAGEFVIPAPPDLRVTGLEARFGGRPALLVVTVENAGQGEASHVAARASIDNRTQLDGEHGRIGPGDRAEVQIVLPDDLAVGEHDVLVDVTPIPADAQPADNSLRKTIVVPAARWWPAVVLAAVLVAAGLGLRTARARRARPHGPAVVTVKPVPGTISARVELPRGASPHGLGLRWISDRGTARVTVTGPRTDKALSETLR